MTRTEALTAFERELFHGARGVYIPTSYLDAVRRATIEYGHACAMETLTACQLAIAEAFDRQGAP